MLNKQSTEKLFNELLNTISSLGDVIVKFDNPVEYLEDIISDIEIGKYKGIEADSGLGEATLRMSITPRGKEDEGSFEIQIDDSGCRQAFVGFNDEIGQAFDDPFQKPFKFVAQDGYIEYNTDEGDDITCSIDEAKVKSLIRVIKKLIKDINTSTNESEKETKKLLERIKNLNYLANDLIEGLRKKLDFKSDNPFDILQPILDKIDEGKYEYASYYIENDILSIHSAITDVESDSPAFVSIVASRKDGIYCLLTGFDNEKLKDNYDVSFDKSFKPKIVNKRLEVETIDGKSISIPINFSKMHASSFNFIYMERDVQKL